MGWDTEQDTSFLLQTSTEVALHSLLTEEGISLLFLGREDLQSESGEVFVLTAPKTVSHTGDQHLKCESRLLQHEQKASNEAGSGFKAGAPL